MGRLCTPEPYVDPVVTVIGEHGTPYPCPDLAALDGHLVELTRRIRLAGLRFPNLVADLRSDIDRLLERRRWLQVAALDGARVAA